MCSNYHSIHPDRAYWVKQKFGCELPFAEWRPEIYPMYESPFIYLKDGKPHCELAQFGLVPHWAINKPRYGARTYNCRSETMEEKPTFRSSWRERKFGLIIMEHFYEPYYAKEKKSVRWSISRTDKEPTVVASIWDRVINRETGEIIFSFSMLTINADGHEVMHQFHKNGDEKRSIVVLRDDDYLPWLTSSHEEARAMLQLAPSGFLTSKPAPAIRNTESSEFTPTLL